jgi:hypothetical protein
MEEWLFGMSNSPIIGHYKITGKIGSGAFSEVSFFYHHADPVLQDVVILMLSGF